jgi:hypothetical protein
MKIVIPAVVAAAVLAAAVGSRGLSHRRTAVKSTHPPGTIEVIPPESGGTWSRLPTDENGRPVVTNAFVARIRPAYAELKSYGDSGTVTEEMPGFNNRWTFRTFYRSPGDFLLDFKGISSDYATGQSIPLEQHVVYWMSNGELHTWNSQFRTHDTYQAGVANQIAPINAGAAMTAGTSTLIPSLLFPNTGLLGVLTETVSFDEAGTEVVAGRPCKKLIGIAQSVYPSGQVFNVRQVTVWIDEQTNLIRKVFTDTPKGYAAGEFYRVTYTIEPRANPPVNDGTFQFEPPSAQ